MAVQEGAALAAALAEVALEEAPMAALEAALTEEASAEDREDLADLDREAFGEDPTTEEAVALAVLWE